MEPDSTVRELVSDLVEFLRPHTIADDIPIRFIGWVGDNDEPIVFNEYIALSMDSDVVEIAIGAADGT